MAYNTKEFNNWFESLSPEEQKKFVEELEADYFIECNKSHI